MYNNQGCRYISSIAVNVTATTTQTRVIPQGEMKMSDIQITKKFGQYSVTALDSNGVRVQVEPGQCTFATREEAQEYVNRWLDVTADLVQIADGDTK